MQIPILKIQFNYPGMQLPERAHDTDSGLDLTLMKIVEKRENIFFFDTGVSVEAPDGYYTELFPRSSIYKHDFIMVNSVGVIDHGYRGILFMPMRYLGKGDGRKAAEGLVGKRIGQLVLRRMEPCRIEVVSELSQTERGGKGLAAADPEISGVSADFSGLRVAIIHYWLVTWRGGEKVLESFLKLFPEADIYTLFYERTVCEPYLKQNRVFSSNLDKDLLRKHYQKLFPLYPTGIRSLKLQQGYDLIISSESGPAKGIVKPDGTPHLCYIHTPMRYCWGYTDTYVDTLPVWARGFARRQFERLREWDRTTIDNVDRYVANSRNVAERVERYYNRPADVCYPPIALDLFEGEPVSAVKNRQGYYLSFGAITPYKNVDLLVDAFQGGNRKLVVIGEGSEKERLQKKAGPNIEFRGALPMVEVIEYIRGSRALLFPGEEDFGMIPLEVMSQGVPVIAYGKGGALETVVENRRQPACSSGLFFNEATSSSLQNALDRFETLDSKFDPVWIKQHARQFGEDRFLREMSGHIADLLSSTKG